MIVKVGELQKRKSKDPLAIASAKNDRRIKELLKRDRLLPCIREYDRLVASARDAGFDDPEAEAFSHLTAILRSTYAEVKQQIAEAGKNGIGRINAIKRSAGTNFQGLCEYAILRWLQKAGLPVQARANAPKSLKDELTIFGTDADGGEFSVEPDIDICLFIESDDPTSPLIFVSAKTSLVDRAGQAARWKLYLDLHQTTCAHVKQVPDCPINRTQVKMRTNRLITHAIVTANIYKIDTSQPHGELLSGQCRNNTYMFRHKFSTRNDEVERRPTSWQSFSCFPALIKQVFATPALPTQAQPHDPLQAGFQVLLQAPMPASREPIGVASPSSDRPSSPLTFSDQSL